MSPTIEATSIEQIQEIVRQSRRVRVVGQQTKYRPTNSEIEGKDVAVLTTSQWSGIVEYDPSEYTLTARSGTPLEVIDRALAAQGQFLPFDPPLIEQGATIGGTVAAGIAGPCRLRHGGTRDFILGIRFVDGLGRLATAGGKVVKNAAGFDLPKLMVGSWGELGILIDVTFKVFPRPSSYRTVRWQFRDLPSAIQQMQKLSRCPIELDGLDITEHLELLARTSGSIESTRRAVGRLLETKLDGCDGEEIEAATETTCWSPLQSWNWAVDGETLIRVPITSSKIAEFDSRVRNMCSRRRYSVAGNVGWLAASASSPLVELDAILAEQRLTGRVVRGNMAPWQRLGVSNQHPFGEAIFQAIDPHQRFRHRL